MSSPLSDVPTDFDLDMDETLVKDSDNGKFTVIKDDQNKNFVIPFPKFPAVIRQRVYHFLGYPVRSRHTLQLLRKGGEIELRERYKVNYCRGALISQPWNYGHGASGDSDSRTKQLNPQFFAPLLLTNKEINAELYDLLYANSMFEVTLNGWRYVDKI
jgi:hypothetical protein